MCSGTFLIGIHVVLVLRIYYARHPVNDIVLLRLGLSDIYLRTQMRQRETQGDTGRQIKNGIRQK